MKFGRKIQENAHPKYRHHYIAYKDLKKAIKLITGSDASAYTIQEVTQNFGNIQALAGSIYRPPESRFQELLNYELDKINKFSSITAAAVLDSLRGILKALRSYDSQAPKRFAELETQLDETVEDVVFLDSYQRLNSTGFRKITKKYDKHNKTSSSSWYMAKLVREPFMNLDIETSLRIISVCYKLLRQLKQPTGIVDAEQEENSLPNHEGSTKYLVQMDDLMRVKVLVLKHIELSAIGGVKTDADQLIETMLDPFGGLKPPQASKARGKHQHRTSSVYFDNETFDMYYNCVAKIKTDERDCFRFRWYGENDGSEEKEVMIETVSCLEPARDILEWSESTVEKTDIPCDRRVVMKQKHIPALIEGKFDSSVWLSKKHLSPDKKAQAKRLLDFIINEIVSKKLRPCIQCWYNRMSFHGDGKGIFINIDENVRFLSETCRDEGNGGWATWSTEALVSEAVKPFPFAVVDVCATSSSKSDFLKEITGLTSVTEVFGFSTFVHGVAALHSHELSRPPHWFKFTTADADVDATDATRGDDGAVTAARVDVIGNQPHSRLLHEQEAARQEFSLLKGDSPATSMNPLPPCPSIPSGASAARREFNELSEPLLINGHPPSLRLRPTSGACPGFVVWPFRKRNRNARSAAQSRPTAPAAAVRVEPKTFFANERTLLQWMNTAVLLATIAITLLNFGTWESRVAGFLLSPVAVFFLVYSFWVYLRRSKSLEKKEPINYNDRLGPGVLVVCLVSALTAIILLNIFYGGKGAIDTASPLQQTSPPAYSYVNNAPITGFDQRQSKPVPIKAAAKRTDDLIQTVISPGDAIGKADDGRSQWIPVHQSLPLLPIDSRLRALKARTSS